MSDYLLEALNKFLKPQQNAAVVALVDTIDRVLSILIVAPFELGADNKS